MCLSFPDPAALESSSGVSLDELLRLVLALAGSTRFIDVQWDFMHAMSFNVDCLSM